MKNLRISWKLVAFFVLGAIGSVFYVTRSRAFTLIELQFIPAVQLQASQSAEIAVSNVSANELEATITTFGLAGRVLSTKSLTLAPGATSTMMVTAGANSPLTFRTTVALGTAGSAVSDVMTFDKTTGEIIVVCRGLLLPAV